MYHFDTILIHRIKDKEEESQTGSKGGARQQRQRGQKQSQSTAQRFSTKIYRGKQI